MARLPQFLFVRALPLVGICLPLLFGAAQAQTAPSTEKALSSESFVEATVVTTKGDSLRGHVQWKAKTPTPETLPFRAMDSKSETAYAPSDLRAVRLDDGRRLVSRAVQVDQVPTDPRAASKFLQSGRDRQQPDTLFLEVLVSGPLAMYAKLGGRNRYYVETDDQTTELLNRQQYLASQNAVATRRRYRRQLRNRMEGCPDAQADTDHLKFRLQTIKNLVARYNRCVGETEVYERANRPRFSTSFGIVGGALRSELAFSNTLTLFNSFGWGTGIQLGGSLTSRLLRTNRHWAVHAELVGIRQRIDANAGRSGYFLGTSILSPSDFVEMTWVKSSVLMRYYLRDADWSPYAEAGITAGYLLDINSQMPEELFNLDSYVLGKTRFTPGVAAGTGLQYRNIQVGVRAELTSAWASYTNFKSRLVNLSLSMGYQF